MKLGRRQGVRVGQVLLAFGASMSFTLCWQELAGHRFATKEGGS
jgi:hypothetical protein